MPEALYGLWVGLRLVLGIATLRNARDWQTPTWTSRSLLPVKLDLQVEIRRWDFATVETLY